MANTFAGESYVQDYIEDTGYGDVITVYMSIKNSAGEIVGVIGSDYDAANIVERLNAITRQVIVMAAICLIAAIAVLSIIVGRTVEGLQMVNRKIYDLVHSEGDLTQKLEITSGDEMELIANNVNKLLEHIRGIMLNIAGNSVQLNNSSKTVVQNLSSAEINITDVSATMEEMSAAMEETSASLNQINESNGYEKLLETSGSYQEDVGNTSRMMQEFADESGEVKQSIDEIKEAISAVSIAVEESAKGVTNVTEMLVDLTSSVGDIGNEANSNMDIANQLNAEVNKFKLE